MEDAKAVALEANSQASPRKPEVRSGEFTSVLLRGSRVVACCTGPGAPMTVRRSRCSQQPLLEQLKELPLMSKDLATLPPW